MEKIVQEKLISPEVTDTAQDEVVDASKPEDEAAADVAEEAVAVFIYILTFC